MPEGNREFVTWMDNIEAIVNRVDVPVIVKKLGLSMSKETFKSLAEIGVQYVDVSGRGGTNFVDIENERRSNKDMDYLTQWGNRQLNLYLKVQIIKIN